jgi:hypothetical protein
VIHAIGRQIIHRLAIGHGDITGDDFGTIFANAVGGDHRARPIGVADVTMNGCAWSIKTVKVPRPFSHERVRLISVLHSPGYSLDISGPRANPANTGRAVLAIWNARVNEALDECDDLRIIALVRNVDTKEFVIFEEEATRFNAGDYQWGFNRNRNLEGRTRGGGLHQFTWQPHGSQFTIIRPIPASARRFKITHNVPTVMPDTVLASIGYRESWISIQ